MKAYTFRVEFVGYGDTPEEAWDDLCESLWSGGWIDMPACERAPELDFADDEDEQDQSITEREKRADTNQ